MVIGFDIAAALPEMQAEAESMMLDTIRVDQMGDTPVFDPATSASTVPVISTPYQGKARVKVADRQALDMVNADARTTVQRYTVWVPVEVTGLRPGLVVTVVESGDLDMVGRTLLINAAQGGTFVTARKFTATDQM